MRRIRFRVGVAFAAIAVVALTTIGGASALAPNGPSSTVVISQVYGGGGNSGATYTNDFIELFNRGASAVSVDGWSVQYGSSGGTTWAATALSGTIAPGGYYLVREAQGAGGTTPLPTPDASGTIAMSGTAGKVALSNSSTSLTGACPASVVDFVGFGGANCSETAATPALSNTTAAIRADGGCADTDNNSSNFSVAAPSPRSSASPGHSCGTTNPSGAGAAEPASVAVGGTSLLTVAVQPGTNPASTLLSVTGNLSSIGGSAAQRFFDDGASSDATAGDGVFSYRATVAPATAPGGKTLPVTIGDAQGRSGSASIGLGVSSACGAAYTHVYDIQGAGAATPLAGQSVTTEGVVVGDDEGPAPALRGFYIQDPTGDGDSATSDGIFVFNGNNDSVRLGDRVRVSGAASEFQGQTQISASTVATCATGLTAPAADVTLPVPPAPAVGGVDYLERFEGMLVRLPQTLTVTEHFQLGRFGQVLMSAGGRLPVPTSVVAPGAPAAALEEANRRDQILLDDPTNDQNPDPILFGRLGNPLSAVNTLRGGDTATGVVGVMTYTWAGNSASGNAFRVRPVEALGGGVPDFQPTNPRPTDPPAVGGNVKVGAMNLLNFFNTFGATACSGGVGGALMDCRGADNAAEFARQWPKTVAAITGLGADVVGIMEIENDGYGPQSAIADLVGKLNDATAPGTWAFVDADAATGQTNALGTDAIKVGVLYKPARVTPVGRTAVLNSVEFVNGGDGAPRNRPSLAQAFRLANGETFVIDANHLKSKGSACDVPDSGDGQANCAGVRTNAARLLASWLATDPTGVRDPDVILVGDLNSYAKEDPIAALEHGGFENLIAAGIGAEAYSYVFDGEWGYLDHALGTPPLARQVAGIGEWHINADEPSVLDYNTDFKSAGQQASLYAPDRYRMSDHDPVLVGLKLETTAAGLCALTREYVQNEALQSSLCVKLRHGLYGAYAHQVEALSGKALTVLHAQILVNLARLL